MNSAGFGPTRHSHRNSHTNSLSTSLFSPFGFGFGSFGDLFAGDNDLSFSTINYMGGPGVVNHGNVRRTSTSTRFIGGKKITTQK